jgi:VIT1/CCC1 family predicted Fe2+/Mn2+ transporter
MQCPKCKAVYPIQTDQTQQNPSETWTPERVENLIKLVDTLASKYVDYKKDEAEADHRWLATSTRFNSILTTILSIFLAVIVGLMSYLTLEGKVSGDALLFLAGTITGYILLFVQRLTKGLFTNGNEAEEESA